MYMKRGGHDGHCVGILFKLGSNSLAYHENTVEMIPAVEEVAHGGFNPVHFTILCLTLIALRVCS